MKAQAHACDKKEKRKERKERKKKKEKRKKNLLSLPFHFEPSNLLHALAGLQQAFVPTKKGSRDDR